MVLFDDGVDRQYTIYLYEHTGQEYLTGLWNNLFIIPGMD
jgi:hypothetical protein